MNSTNAFSIQKKRRKPKPKTKVDKNLDKRLKKIESLIEYDYFDQTPAVKFTIPTEEVAGPIYDWSLFLINSVPSNGGVTAQIGHRNDTSIKQTSLLLRCEINNAPAATGGSRVRVVLFTHKNGRGVAPTPAQLFNLQLAVPPTFAFYNNEYKDSFKIHWDKTYLIEQPTYDSTTMNLVPDIFNINKRFKIRRTIKYLNDNGTGTVADVLDNALYIAFITSSAYGAGSPPVNNPQVYFTTRIYFTDV